MQARQFSDVFPVVGTYSATVNPANLIDAAGESINVTASGVKLGEDAVLCFVPGVNLSGITVTAYVSADNTITVRLQNESGGTLDLASSTWRFVVAKVRAR